MYLEGHRPALGWWDAAGWHAACECGWESGPLGGGPKGGEKALAIHLGEVGERAVTIIEQDAVELPDEPEGVYGRFPEGF